MHRIDSKTIKTHTLELQRFLNLHKQTNGSKLSALVEDGQFGKMTQLALDNYMEHFDSITFATNKANSGLSKYPYWVETATRLRMIAEIAITHIGETELPRNMGFTKKAFAELMNYVGFQPGHAWCAYFVEACYTQVFNDDVRKKAYTKLFSASTQTTLRNFAAHENFIIVPDSISYEGAEFIAPAGCMAFWQSRSKPTLGHVGIKSMTQDGIHHSRLRTIDGNTNDGGSREGNQVAEKTRDITSKTSSLRFQGLIFGDFLDVK